MFDCDNLLQRLLDFVTRKVKAMKRPSHLTSQFVERITEAGRFSDGRRANGLSLLVTKTKLGHVRRSFSQRLRVNGKLTNRGLGGFPDISLDDARRMAAANVLQSATPSAPTITPDAPIFPQFTTFEDVAMEALALRKRRWKSGGATESQWQSIMGKYILPHLGDMNVAEITARDIVRVLDPVWFTMPATAHKVQMYLQRVLVTAIALNYCQGNPMTAALTLLGPAIVSDEHRVAAPYDECSHLIDEMQYSRTEASTQAVFEYIILNGLRRREAEAARFREIDWNARTMTIPANRMKAGREHVIPLADRSIKILEEAWDRIGGNQNKLIFPSRAGRLLDVSTMIMWMRRRDYDYDMHGFRSSLSDWNAEIGQFDSDLMEAQLAHKDTNRVRAAYRRSDFLDRRRAMMDAWADYLQG